MKFILDTEVSQKFPHLFANITIIKGFNNKPSQHVADAILKILKESELMLRSQFISKEELFNDKSVTSYFECFRQFGVNPKRVLPSHVALAERVVKGGSLPNINPAVNLYNAFSIKYLIPFGGEDLDKIDEYFKLTIAKGDETWTGIGETETISPKVGDLIWRDKIDVSTLSLNWRQCEKTKLTQDSQNGYFISEGFANVNKEHIEKIAQEFVQTFTSLLGGVGEAHIITKENPEVAI